MTTIRAHPPVETPAGLVVALPPDPDLPTRTWLNMVKHRIPQGMTGQEHSPDVFALAVPCPQPCTAGWFPTDPQTPDRSVLRVKCRCDDGWVHHGDYRVLEVLPIVAHLATADFGSPARCISVTADGQSFELHDGRGVGTSRWIPPLPSAVPGGVALIVERVEP